MNIFKNYLFRWWVISFILGIMLFTLNPLLGIFVAITMVPIFIHDIMVKLFIEKVYEEYQK